MPFVNYTSIRNAPSLGTGPPGVRRSPPDKGPQGSLNRFLGGQDTISQRDQEGGRSSRFQKHIIFPVPAPAGVFHVGRMHPACIAMPKLMATDFRSRQVMTAKPSSFSTRKNSTNATGTSGRQRCSMLWLEKMASSEVLQPPTYPTWSPAASRPALEAPRTKACLPTGLLLRPWLGGGHAGRAA
jgi:hypothetical protein